MQDVIRCLKQMMSSVVRNFISQPGQKWTQTSISVETVQVIAFKLFYITEALALKKFIIRSNFWLYNTSSPKTCLTYCCEFIARTISYDIQNVFMTLRDEINCYVTLLFKLEYLLCSQNYY